AEALAEAVLGARAARFQLVRRGPVAGQVILGPVGRADVKAIVILQAHLGHRPGGIDEEGHVGHRHPARVVARVGAADALVEAAREAADLRLAVAAAAAAEVAAGQTAGTAAAGAQFARAAQRAGPATAARAADAAAAAPAAACLDNAAFAASLGRID